MGIADIFTFAGGVGLFLLGMRLMTDGLKVAAGNTLRDILVAATRSKGRGVASGILITTMVQSSSAVIFATIGFVNAGLLTLGQAIGVIYGANVGTTLTSWIVALVGFNVNLQAMALPAIGVGMGLWVSMGSRRYGAIGQALAGFGLFFLGIDILKDSFAGSGDGAWMQLWAERGTLGLLLFVAAGTFLTALMQSSSAALAVTLTAAAGGLIPLNAAAAMVIGANVGTTSTALFAIIGATPAAKRAAIAHVAFNAITAIVAFTILPVLLMIVDWIARATGLGTQPAVLLAIFHTMTKLLGLALMWPATGQMVRQLEKRFLVAEADEARSHYLDHNIQTAPVLALDALAMELDDMGLLARRLAKESLQAGSSADIASLQAGWQALEKRNIAVGEFAAGINRQEHDPLLTAALPHALRVSQYYVNIGEHAVDFCRLRPAAELNDEQQIQSILQLRSEAVSLLELTDNWGRQSTLDDVLSAARQFEKHYDDSKHHMLSAGALGRITASRMVSVLEQLDTLHRMVKQTVKAVRYMDAFAQACKPVVEDKAEHTDKTGEESAAHQEQEQEKAGS